MTQNPYQAPTTCREAIPKRPYTRAGLLLDIFAIVLTLPAPITRVIIARLSNNPIESLTVPLGAYLFSVLIMWLVALILNIIGSIKGRPLPVVGLLLNLAFVAMVIFRLQ